MATPHDDRIYELISEGYVEIGERLPPGLTTSTETGVVMSPGGKYSLEIVGGRSFFKAEEQPR